MGILKPKYSFPTSMGFTQNPLKGVILPLTLIEVPLVAATYEIMWHFLVSVFHPPIWNPELETLTCSLFWRRILTIDLFCTQSFQKEEKCALLPSPLLFLESCSTADEAKSTSCNLTILCCFILNLDQDI